MVGAGHVNEPPTVVRQDDEHEEQPEGDRRDDEQVGGHDLAGVTGQERSPPLRRRAVAPAHVLGDGGLTHGDPQLLELAVMRGAPQSGFAVDSSRMGARTSAGTPGRPVRCRRFQRQN
jgi:hypothetical protein